MWVSTATASSPALSMTALGLRLSSVTLMLTLLVWFSYNIEGVREKGVIGYLKGWVPAGVTGTVVEVCAENAQPVEFGAPLFRVRPGR